MEINKDLLDSLFEQAKENPRLRQNLDLRTSSADTSQRMLNALLPGTRRMLMAMGTSRTGNHFKKESHFPRSALQWRMQCTARTVAVHCGSGCSALRPEWQN